MQTNYDLNNEVGVTRTIAMTGSRIFVKPPKRAYEVIISAPDGYEAVWYESSASYVEDGITYGTGYSAQHQVQSVTDKGFWISGTNLINMQLEFVRGE